jgi:glycine cleavage system transcriptional repressor
VPDYAVTAIGRDKPGIVAAISRVLLELEGNIEDSRMSILRGHFAVMLIVRVPEGTAEEDLTDRLGAVRDELGLEALTYNPVGESSEARPTASHVVSVYGADHPGIVAGISAVLAAEGVNITDLETRVGGSPDAPIYMMLVEVALGGAPLDGVKSTLVDAAAEAGVEVTMRELDAEAL